MPGAEPNRTLTFGLWILPLLVEIPLARMLTLSDLRRHIVETVTLLLVTSLFYLVSVWLVLQSGDRVKSPPLGWILSAGLLFRLTVFPLFPAFSDDLYRYRWEGKIQESGHNPYLLPPKDLTLASQRDSLYVRIDGKDFPAVYGPLIELEQRAVYRIVTWFTPDPARQLFWFKAPAALADLGIMAALLLLLRARGQPLSRVLVYSWCPLPVFEFWATGHNDAIVILLVVLALAFAARNRALPAAIWLSLATLAKFWPALLFPILTGYRWRRILAAVAVLSGLGAVAFAPYTADLSRNARFATGFLGGWRNNDSLHAIIAAAAGDPYVAKYITMALIMTAALILPLARLRNEARTLLLIVTVLAFSANVHPWYLTWIVPLLALYPVPGLLLWVSLAPLAYASLIDWTLLGVWNGLSPLRWLVYAPVAAVLLWGLARNRSASAQ